MRQTTRAALTTTLCAGALLALASSQAHAGGFGLREGSADWMGNAFAGDTAKAYDASTAWSNPAGMVRLDRSEIDGSINGIFPTLNFSGANFIGPGRTTPGTTGGNLIQSSVTAGVYGVWSYSPDFKFGLAAGAPFGQRIAYPGDFVGRYQSLVSSISDEQIAISGAWRINDQWSIGGGPVIDVFSSRLTQALNIGAASAVTGDPAADVHGSDVAAGFNLGVLYQITPSMRIGLDYRSRITHDISGSQDIFVPPLLGVLSPATAAVLRAQASPAGTKITLPDSVTAGFYYQATQQLALLVDLSWTDWSLLKSINIVPTSPTAVSTTINENWRNTVAVSVGANYRLNQSLMLQGGFSFDESPVTDSNRNSRIPDSNRYLIGVGAQYDVLSNLTLQVAYAHVFFAGADVNTQASATSGVLIGKYSTSADTVSLGAKYQF
jgi:long-chain fatty acid transport protein